MGSRSDSGTAGQEHTSSLKSWEILLNRDFFLSLMRVKLAPSLPSTLLFLEISRTPREPSQALWVSWERKKPALHAKQPGTWGWLPARGFNTLSRYQQRGNREIIWGAGGGTGKAWQGQGVDALSGTELWAEPRALLACLLNMSFIKVADTAVCQAKIFIVQLLWMQWKEARGFLAQPVHIPGP